MTSSIVLSVLCDDRGRGRRVVASPRPLKIIEIDVSRSAYCRSVSAWVEERIRALKAERAAS